MISAELVKGVTDPTDGPDDNHDVTLTDEDGLDVLAFSTADLTNRDTSNTEAVPLNIDSAQATDPGRTASLPVNFGKLTVTVANAGATKSGVLTLYLRGDIFGE